MRNAVKATVDAYDGTVNLYAWDETDPMLKAWRSAFPGTVQDRDDIPDSLLEHMRYPEDLFKVQRYQFARYHVTDPGDFYQGNDRWEVPEDPYAENSYQPPYRLFVDDPTTTGDETWSLTSTFTPYDKNNLAAFLSVNSDATSDDYGGDARPAAAQRADAGPGADRQRDGLQRQRQTRAAGLQHRRDDPQLRQPADVARGGGADVRPAGLRHPAALRGQLPDPAVRDRLVRRRGRHRRLAGRGAGRRARRRPGVGHRPDAARAAARGATTSRGPTRAPTSRSPRCCARPRPPSTPPTRRTARATRSRPRSSRSGPAASSSRRSRSTRGAPTAATPPPRPPTADGRAWGDPPHSRPIWVRRSASRKVVFTDAGWSSSVARWAHNPEVAGSNPAPATKKMAPDLQQCRSGAIFVVSRPVRGSGGPAASAGGHLTDGSAVDCRC